MVKEFFESQIDKYRDSELCMAHKNSDDLCFCNICGDNINTRAKGLAEEMTKKALLEKQQDVGMINDSSQKVDQQVIENLKNEHEEEKSKLLKEIEAQKALYSIFFREI